MHRQFRRKLRLPNDIAVVVRPVLLLLFVIVETPWYFAKYPCSVAMTTDKLQECRDVPCKVGEQCVVRKFWCSNPPCPTMVYCSKSRTESLKGPESCHSVVCPKGYECLTQVNDCNWDKKCKHRITRCVTSQVYQNHPTNCDDVTCPPGHRCILREMNCYRPPCRLTKNCARNADASAWMEQCKQIGCRSEYDCFLRKPQKNCTKPPCNHTPDCLNEVENYETVKDERSCRGWICPRGQECFIHQLNPDCHEDCITTKECRDLSPKIPKGFFEPTDITFSDSAFAEFEQVDFLEQHRKSEDHFPNESAISSTKSQDFFISLSNNPRDYDDSNERSAKMKRLSPTSTPSQLDTSLADSQWQSYLKRKAGSEAVQYWVAQSKNKEKYGEFAEWLDSVADLLDRVSYAKWLHEVRRASANVPEFQAWLQQYHRSCQSDINAASDPDTLGYQARIGPSPRDRTLAQKPGGVVGIAGDSDGNARLEPSTQVPAGYILASRMQNAPSPDFKFNEAAAVAAVAAIPSHLNTNAATTLAYQRAVTPSIALPLPLHYLAMPQQNMHHDPGDLRQLHREPDLNEALRSSWNTLQSYYRMSSPSPQPRYYVPSVFPDTSSTQPVKPLVPNFSRIQNFSVTPSEAIFNLNKWLPRMAQDIQPMKIVNMEVDEDGVSAGRNAFNVKEKLPEHLEADTQLVKKMIDQISIAGGNTSTPYIFNLMNSTNYQDQNNSHLLIYFPSPLNLLICVTYQDELSKMEQNNQRKVNYMERNTKSTEMEDELNKSSTPANIFESKKEKPGSLDEQEMNDREAIILLKMKPHLHGAVAAGMKYLLDSIKAPKTETDHQFESPSKVDSLLKEIGKAIHGAIAEIVNEKQKQNPSTNTRSMKKEICDEKCKEDALKELNNPSMKEFLQWLMRRGHDSNPFFETPDLNEESQNSMAAESVKQTEEPSSLDDMKEKGVNVLQCLPKDEINKKEKNNNCTKLNGEDLSKIEEFLHWLKDKGFNSSSLLRERANKQSNDPSSFDENFDDQNSEDPSSNVENSDGRRSKSGFFDIDETHPEDSDPKEIRIKVDLDKSPESIRSLFTNNLNPNDRNEPSDNHEIQLTINLKSDTDDTNEAKMSRKVIDMAIKLTNANKTSNDDQQMPKVLWVFPSYEDPPNENSPPNPAKRINLDETQKKVQESELQGENEQDDRNNKNQPDEYDENYDESDSYDQGGESAEYDEEDDS